MNRFRVLVLSLLLLAAFGLALLPVVYSRADAAAETPPGLAASPRQNSVEWVVRSDVFESNYPDGFTVTLDASSPAGEIVRASLVWHRPVLRPTQTLWIEREPGEIDAESGTIRATWEPGATLMLPPWAQLTYHWELRDDAGNVYDTEPVTVEYADHTREWERRESEDAIVYAQGLPGEIETIVLDAMREQHDKYVAVWGQPLPYKPRIVLFGDYDAWLEWRTVDHHIGGTDVVVGQTFEQWGVIAQVVFGFDRESAYAQLAYATVVHEIEHLYQAEFLWPTRRLFDIPAWFIEGDATFFELEQTYNYLGRVQAMARAGELPPLLVGVANGPRVDGPTPRDGYDIGYSFWVWLQETTGGLEAHHDLMALLAANTPFFEALETVTGMSTTEIERNWRTWLGATGDAPTLVPTWTPAAPILFASPTPFGR